VEALITIAVGAIADDGKKAFYSEQGANLLITAPSSGDNQEITTVAINSGYRSDFGGTSAATPLVAGVSALILESNPNLGWRDVQEILITSAQQIDPSNSDWTNNAAGFHFNHNYGPGMIDAQAAVTLAQTWNNLSTQNTRTVELNNIDRLVRNNTTETFTIDFSNEQNLRVEHARLYVEATHSRPGELEIILTSPYGTKSKLTVPKNMDQSNIDFSFLTVRSWGEHSQGEWIVTIADTMAGNRGTIETLRLELYGTDSAPDNGPPTISSSTFITSEPGETLDYQITATTNPTSFTATNLPDNLSINTSTGLISGTVNTAGYSTFNISATNNNGTTTEEITLLTADEDTPGIPLAVDISSQSFSHSGNSDWMWTTACNPTSSNSFILQSGNIEDDETSTIQTTLTGPGTLHFDWAVSSEQNFDFLIVSINNIELEAISGNTSFTKKSIIIPSGNHTITWTYSKDLSVSEYYDSGYIDRIRYSAANSYEAFIDNHLPDQEYTPEAQPLADNDNDGIDNLTEFFLGTNPTTLTNNPPIITTHSATQSTIEITTNPNLTGINHVFQTSLDLKTWNPLTPSTLTQTSTTLIQEASIPHSDETPKNFLRLLIEKQ